MQVLFTIPEMTQCYNENRFLDRGDLSQPDADLKLQLSKLCRGLLSGDYSLGPDWVGEELLREEGSQPGIRPTMFKNLIGKGHPEFSTNKQQDAQEFFLHLVTQIGKEHRYRYMGCSCCGSESEIIRIF
jgi:ubiquitin carboxyl-terminal hydrolase 5/13